MKNLSRLELKKIAGGYENPNDGNCRIGYSTSDGGVTVTSITVSGSTCADQIAACQSYADNLVTSGQAVQATYDTGCDGWGH